MEPAAAAIMNALSAKRLAPYVNAADSRCLEHALELYAWNALLAGAMLPVLHVFEVVFRNAVADGIQQSFGAAWPWANSFERSLAGLWKAELHRARQTVSPGDSDRVVSNLKFAFWSNVLTSRHDDHIWRRHLRSVFPGLPLPLSIEGGRTLLFGQCERLRKLRNRVAHHEPIFNHPILELNLLVADLVRMRCPHTQQWLTEWEQLGSTYSVKPLYRHV